MKILYIISLIIFLSISSNSSADIRVKYQKDSLLKKSIPGNWTMITAFTMSRLEYGSDDIDDPTTTCEISAPPTTPFSENYKIEAYSPVKGDSRYFAFRFTSKLFDGKKRIFKAGNVFGEGPKNRFRATYLKATPVEGTRTFLSYDVEDIKKTSNGYTATIKYSISEAYTNANNTYCVYEYTGTISRRNTKD